MGLAITYLLAIWEFPLWPISFQVSHHSLEPCFWKYDSVEAASTTMTSCFYIHSFIPLRCSILEWIDALAYAISPHPFPHDSAMVNPMNPNVKKHRKKSNPIHTIKLRINTFLNVFPSQLSQCRQWRCTMAADAWILLGYVRRRTNECSIENRSNTIRQTMSAEWASQPCSSFHLWHSIFSRISLD